MSRHVYDQNGIRTVIGWDPPLQTFFIQQGPIDWDGKWLNNGGDPVTWLGMTFQSIPDIEELHTVCFNYNVGLSPEAFKTLEQDQISNK